MSGHKRPVASTMDIEDFTPASLLGSLNDVERRNAPESLYVVGHPSLLRQGPRVSVVGSRKASPEGRRRARALCEALVGHGMTVVSGLAEGIDTVAHETAIARGGHTIAVLGTPLDQFYPASNRALQERISRDHLLVSQFPVGYPSKRGNFPMRNRTMALLTDATIIVEAGETSGTLHQGWEALRLGRPVFLLENLFNADALSWPKEMTSHGAQVLSRANLPTVLQEMPARPVGEAVAL